MTKIVDKERSTMGRSNQQMSWPELIAALICLSGATGYWYLVTNLPAGHSRGDVGPAALPYGVAIFSVVLSVALIVLAFRLLPDYEKPSFPAFERVGLFIGAFFVVPIAANYIGLAVSVSVAVGLVTLLFSGNRRLSRALATAIATWLIAEFLFARFLGLPLP